MSIRVALIELGGSHDECLYTQIKILKSVRGLHLTLICNHTLASSVMYFDGIDKVNYINVKKGLSQWGMLFSVWNFCRNETFDILVFNTAQGKIISRFLKFPLPQTTRLYGTIHDISKLKNSKTQRAISRKLKNYFVLNPYLRDEVLSWNLPDIRLAEYYPFIFPEYPTEPIEKPPGEIWVCVPGQVENKRRDYKGLFKSIEENGLAPNIKIMLLGRCEHKYGDGFFVKQEIIRLSLEKHVQVFDDYIPVENFHQYIGLSDYILPLIHPGDVSYELYHNQITGAFNLAAGYQKPLLLEKDFTAHRFDDFEVVIYSKNDLAKTFYTLTPNSTTPKYASEVWSFACQQKKYLDFLEINVPD